MEIIEGEARRGEDLVQVAYTDTPQEAALIRGLLREEKIRSMVRQASVGGGSLGTGLITHHPRRIYVRPEQAARARELIGEIMVEDPAETEIPESANAEYLADAAGGKPRDYSVFGAYARAYIAAIVVLGLILIVFLVLR
jgi:hypothetical protein